MFDAALQTLMDIAREAWMFIAAIIIVVGLIGALIAVLKGVTGASFGSSQMAGIAIVSAVGIVILILVGFLVIPSLGDILRDASPNPPF